MYKKMLSYTKGNFKWYFVLFICLGIKSAESLISPLIVSKIIDQSIGKGDIIEIIQGSIFAIFLYLSASLAAVISQGTTTKIERRITVNIRQTVLFANLLDNAIDACKSCQEDTRRIFLRIHRFKDYVVIKMINTMNQTPRKNDEKLISTKKNHKGLGMEILMDLSNKYCGNISYSYTDVEFETKIILSTNSKL